MACFITFEGSEGCGKTTQIRILADRLKAIGHGVITTREPGGCPIADKIRGILLDAENGALTPLSELLLYAAARSQHMAEVVKPALACGHVVLCDRFTDATVAYQGYGRQLDRETIDRLNVLATGGIRPDITVLLDCPVEIGLKRAMARINTTSGAREERFELEAMEFHRRVRSGYLELAAREPERFIVINGAAGVEETSVEIEAAILARLPGGS
ncbi:MAG: dTMP kinase [Geobacter sp.]|nr:MAG: dTMP kinase [Geobacter sp.]